VTAVAGHRTNKRKGVGRSQPAAEYDVAAEATLIGGILIEPEILDAVFAEVSPQDFYHPRYRAVAAAARLIRSRGETVNNSTVAAELESTPAEAGAGSMLDVVGGRAHLAILMVDALTDGPKAVDLARIVARRAAGRRNHVARNGSSAAESVPDDADDATSGRARGAKERLLAIASNVQLFHCPENEPYADVAVNSHRETWRLGSDGFNGWLRRACWDEHGEAPPEPALKDAVLMLMARARYEGVEIPVHLRYGMHQGTVYIDLLDASRRAVEITSTGWRLMADPPVRFRRGSSAQELCEPVAGGSLEELLMFLNLPDDGQASWRLVLAWLTFAALPGGPYPPLVLGGQQDSGKSVTARVLRALIDPDHTPLTPAPRDEEDFIVVATDNWLPVLDNLSYVENWLSDALCRLSDGTGLKRRQRYTDSGVAVVRAKRPVILNGIGELATRGDLLSRALILRLPPLDDGRRWPEQDFWVSFREAMPRILGGFYDALVGVLAELPNVNLPRPPRMADFARVGVAMERVLGWPAGSFLAAYADNRAIGSELALEAYPIVGPLCQLVTEHRGHWEGSMSGLLAALEPLATDQARHERRWPGAASKLSSQLDRVAPSLRARGVVLDHGRGNQGSWVSIRELGTPAPNNISTSVSTSPSPTLPGLAETQ